MYFWLYLLLCISSVILVGSLCASMRKCHYDFIDRWRVVTFVIVSNDGLERHEFHIYVSGPVGIFIVWICGGQSPPVRDGKALIEESNPFHCAPAADKEAEMISCQLNWSDHKITSLPPETHPCEWFHGSHSYSGLGCGDSSLSSQALWTWSQTGCWGVRWSVGTDLIRLILHVRGPVLHKFIHSMYQNMRNM